MFELNFKINKIYLYAQIVKQAKFLGKQGEILENRLWEKSKIVYSMISGVYYDRVVSNITIKNSTIKSFSKNLSKNIELIKKILDQELNSIEFIEIYKETEDYKKETKKQWGQNRELGLRHLRDITGLKLSNITLSVYLVHPLLHDGRYWTDNIITWGHSEDWKNYTTVYLCHEIMHFLTKDYAGDKKLLHALIELACDNELRIRLNQSGKYFREGRFRVGHESLQKIEKKILPQWRQYLQDRKRGKLDILNLTKELDNMTS